MKKILLLLSLAGVMTFAACEKKEEKKEEPKTENTGSEQKAEQKDEKKPEIVEEKKDTTKKN
ncbi:hypothetical protein [Raineya sp.]|jgi:protein involved in sex pheromone biosynthesis